MKRLELLTLIESGENLKVEFKLRFSSFEKVAKEFIAFANTKGGFIIFGVDDMKRIVGVESEKSETELIKETFDNYCYPPIDYKIEYKNIDDKELVIVEVFESINKPHRIQDYKKELDVAAAHVYVRVNDKSILASKEMIRVLRSQYSSQSLQKYFIGNLEKKVFEHFQMNESITVKELCEISNISIRRASRTLVKMVRANLLLIHTKDNGETYFTSC